MPHRTKADNPFDCVLSWPEAATRSQTRSTTLDLVKWVALILMTLGQTRFVWPEMEWASYPGRFTFVALCAVMAAHAHCQGEPSHSTWRQLAFLATAAVVSQWPYHALTGRDAGNIMVTLACGLSVMTGMRLPGWRGTALGVAGIAIPLCFAMEYGIIGTLLPIAFFFALSGTRRCWPVPIALAAISQSGGLLLMALAAASALAVLVLLERPIPLSKIPRVGRWAYAYYPAHQALLVGITYLVR
ncbi:TraX family protein [Pseudomonas chlororaphis]|uniref:TraX family protein n=1 Tax=Pseudomonas chlororaphis TaxID=587753 RepID=UPI000F572F86|nr:hypothetical protein C4K32_0903 [Pseudomonas chlororaphis subsp. piscium]AZD96771.1 hypothetical protein C4K12_0886 [Pseudomonas chlororaphis subsp. aureofaciens]